jgi:hypothetical protein
MRTRHFRPAPIARSTFAGFRWECCTRSRSCLDHADQGIHASRAPKPSKSTGDQPAPSPASGVALHLSATSHVPGRGLGSRPTTWLARVTHAPSSPYSPGPTSTAVVAAQRLDHRPLTDRSRGRQLVHPSITRHWAAPWPQGVNDETASGHTAALACLRLPSPAGTWAAGGTSAPAPFDRLQPR